MLRLITRPAETLGKFIGRIRSDISSCCSVRSLLENRQTKEDIGWHFIIRKFIILRTQNTSIIIHSPSASTSYFYLYITAIFKAGLPLETLHRDFDLSRKVIRIPNEASAAIL